MANPSVPMMMRQRPAGSYPLRGSDKHPVVMPRIKDRKTLAAAGVEMEDGRRPAIVSAPAAAPPELLDRPRRRTFTAQAKLRILGKADRAAGVPGGIGAIVRREGLYAAALPDWRLTAPRAPSKR